MKYKIKSKVALSYKSEDSTLSNAKLESKSKTVYNREGLEVESVEEDSTGKVINRSEHKYNSKNQLLIESIYYDSLNVVTSSLKYRYDNLGRVIETINSALNFTSKPYVDKNKYDTNGNMIESSTELSGVVVRKYISKFDAQNRLINTELYHRNNLIHKKTYVHDVDGGDTMIDEYYQDASGIQSDPNKNRTTTKYNSKNHIVSSTATSEDNGVLSTTKTINEYKYDKDKLLLVKTVFEKYGEGCSSKSTSSQSYKYDEKGNVIEYGYKCEGESDRITKYKYNSNNLRTELTTYVGNCMDKPASIFTFMYYPDGVTLKETLSVNHDFPSTMIERFDERGLITETIYTGQEGTTHVVYKYEFW